MNVMDYGGYFAAAAATTGAGGDRSALDAFGLNPNLNFSTATNTNTSSMAAYGNTVQQQHHQQQLYGQYASSYGQLAGGTR